MIKSKFDISILDAYQVVFPAGHTLFREGEPGREMYILLDGEIEITKSDHILDRLTNGAIFGEMALVDSFPRSADARAVTDCKIVIIDEALFSDLASQYPHFGVDVMRIMSKRIRRMINEEMKRQRLEEELAIGREIQLSLLPKVNPQRAGWQFATVYRAARQVGGDYYDFIESPSDPNLLTMTVSDVTGKGVPAAIFMASMRSVMRTLCIDERSPADILKLTNQSVVRDTGSALFLSSVAAQLNFGTNELTMANAGHEWPLWVKASRDDVETLVVPGVILGAFDEIQPVEKKFKIEPGDFLLFFTDGVTEARNQTGEFFGDDRLLETAVLAKYKNAADIAIAIETAVDQFTQGTPQSDDMTLVVIKRES
ncbi:MAG: SpoIIE family protein phosphatase [Chloroflexota bacterium]